MSKFGSEFKRKGQIVVSTNKSPKKGKIKGKNRSQLNNMKKASRMMGPLFMGNIFNSIFSVVQLQFGRILIKNLKESIRKNNWHSHNWLTNIISERKHPQLRDSGLMYKSIVFKPILSPGRTSSSWVGFPAGLKTISGSKKASKLDVAKIAYIHDQTGSTIKITKRMQNFFFYVLFKNSKMKKKFGGDISPYIMYSRVKKIFPIGKVLIVKPRPFFDRAIKKTYAEFPIALHFTRLMQAQLAKSFSFMKL